ncbi:hypothetical protein VTN00DRAFT_6998 [Thermoascus crustaceus]|uniref:uncharacterized protein n=1 Tax=Thermoascus crustaceus TaxID=5088 RepID=UPI0037429DE5
MSWDLPLESGILTQSPLKQAITPGKIYTQHMPSRLILLKSCQMNLHETSNMKCPGTPSRATEGNHQMKGTKPNKGET